MFLALDTCTVQCRNELPLMRTVHALEFPRKRTDTQPPPATDEKELNGCVYTTALLSTIVQPLTLTLNISKAAIAPPQVQHGSDGLEVPGQSSERPVAEILEKVLL